jgi:prepilin-type N-terminal cleavage/methylation domain-containing protein
MTKFQKSYINLLLFAFKPKPSGYTLLESIMALVVVGILITSVAPMLALATASRVQARRVDQATQAFRAYNDGVRGGALPIPQKFVVVDPNVDFKPPFYSFPPVATMITAPETGTLVDTNGNGFSVDDPQDLVIQAIRPIAFCTLGIPAVVGPPAVPAVPPVACPRTNATEIAAETDKAKKQGFVMVTRVYRADAFANGAAPTGTEQANVFIGTLGSRENPLVSSIGEIIPNPDLGSIIERDNTALGQ